MNDNCENTNHESCKVANSVDMVCASVFIRPMRLAKAGGVIHGHTHNYPHLSQIMTGTVKIVTSSETDPSYVPTIRVFEAPSFLLVPAEIRHEITALTDDVIIWCTFAHRDSEGQVVDEYPGKGMPHREITPGSDFQYQ